MISVAARAGDAIVIAAVAAANGKNLKTGFIMKSIKICRGRTAMRHAPS
jgi:hypothetical protein